MLHLQKGRFCTYEEDCVYHHEEIYGRERDKSSTKKNRGRTYSEEDITQTESLKNRVRELEETVATLKVSLFTLQGQLLLLLVTEAERSNGNKPNPNQDKK